jgi:hypothetical protein
MIEALHHAASQREWKDSAVDEMATTSGELFDDQTRRHRSTGQSIEEYVQEWEKLRPHVFVTQATDMDEMAVLMTAFLGDAGKRSLTDLGKARNQLGSDEALKAAAATFNISDPYNLREVGVAPGNIGKMIDAKKATAEADALEARAAQLRKAADLAAPKKNGEDHSSNPWSQKGWSITRQGSLAKSMSIDKVARIAAAVGCKIGDTRPNANYK